MWAEDIIPTSGPAKNAAHIWSITLRKYSVKTFPTALLEFGLYFESVTNNHSSWLFWKPPVHLFPFVCLCFQVEITGIVKPPIMDWCSWLETIHTLKWLIMIRRGSCAIREVMLREREQQMNPPHALDKAQTGFYILLLPLFLIKSDVENSSVRPLYCVEHVVKCHHFCFS